MSTNTANPDDPREFAAYLDSLTPEERKEALRRFRQRLEKARRNDN